MPNSQPLLLGEITWRGGSCLATTTTTATGRARRTRRIRTRAAAARVMESPFLVPFLLFLEQRRSRFAVLNSHTMLG
ncbi:hypothetical protein CLOM_g2657 [Closterium sp. NIES-68]|nr:hypothetical protein CLOM_g2657 [Closterium sp. NIES-68]